MPVQVDEVPHSDEAERAALGSVLLKPAALGDLADVEVDDLFQPVNREILEAMRAIAKRGDPVDVVALYDELVKTGKAKRLDGGISHLTGLADGVPTAENAGYYAGIIRGKATRRRVIAACGELMSGARGDVDTVELLSDARSKFATIETRGVSATRHVGDDFDEVVKRMEARGMASADPRGTTVTTCLTKLDAILGPLRADNLVAIGANPGRGKSALALGIAIRNAMRGIPALVFSLEMSRAQLIERGIAFDARVNGRRVNSGRMDRPEWRRVMGSAFASLPIWINDDRMTIGRLQGEVRTWRAKRRRERLAAGLSAYEADLALVVVDYVQLIDADTNDDSKRYQALGKVSRELKLLTKERDANLPIIECVQLNRENMKRNKDGKPAEPQISDLRDAGNLEQDADTIMFPWWEGDPAAEDPHDAEILVRKQRSGIQGRARVSWEGAYMTFRDRVEPDDPRLPAEPERDSR